MTASEEMMTKLTGADGFADVADQREQDEDQSERYDGLTTTLGSASTSIEEAAVQIEQLVRQNGAP